MRERLRVMCSVHGLAVSLGPALSHSAVTFCKQNTTVRALYKTSRFQADAQLLQSLRHVGGRPKPLTAPTHCSITKYHPPTVELQPFNMLNELRFGKNSAAVALAPRAQN